MRADTALVRGTRPHGGAGPGREGHGDPAAADVDRVDWGGHPVLGRVEVWDGRDPSDRAQWTAAWERMAGGDPFSHPGFLQAFAGPGEVPLCAHLRGIDGEEILHALLARPIVADACGRPVEEGLWDAYTVLLYGGPLAQRSSEALRAAFHRGFGAWARDHGLVSEFVRMSPVESRRLPYPGRVREQAPHIVRDLRGMTLETLWADVRSTVRRGVGKARAAGLTVALDTDGSRLTDFLRIYDETMDRVGAVGRFRFTGEAFERMHAALPGRFAYVYSMHEDEPVAVELMLHSDTTGYFHLGGTRTEALPLYASVHVHWEAIAHAWRSGLSEYVLTGGVTNTREDSLLRFKRNFAPQGEALYLTGERIFDTDAYDRLTGLAPTAEGAESDGAAGGFFPAYRAPHHPAACRWCGPTGSAPDGVPDAASAPAEVHR